MATTRTYPMSAFGGPTISAFDLTNAVEAAIPANPFEGIRRDVEPDDEVIFFFVDNLTAPEESALDGVVAAATGVPSRQALDVARGQWDGSDDAEQNTRADVFTDALVIEVVTGEPRELLVDFYVEKAALTTTTTGNETRIVKTGAPDEVLAEAAARFDVVGSFSAVHAGRLALAVLAGTHELKVQFRRVGGAGTDAVAVRRARLTIVRT
jgi:hypothetical protein